MPTARDCASRIMLTAHACGCCLQVVLWGSFAGRPLGDRLYEEKQDTKKNVCQFVPSCRARKEWATIQAWDSLFRQNRFKSSNPRSECKCLKINNNICTDPQEIAENLTMSLPSSPLSSADIPDLESLSFFNCENISDTEVVIDEIESALNTLKLGRAGGIDLLDSKHIILCFGGEALKLWLKKIFNRIITSIRTVPSISKLRLGNS